MRKSPEKLGFFLYQNSRFDLVEHSGFEPLISAMRTRRFTS
jgi:hypothetical protein